MITSDMTDELNKALVGARAEFPELQKKTEAHYGKFVDYNTVREAIDPVLANHGLLVIQIPEGQPDPGLTTRLVHVESGQWLEATTALALSKKDPQAQGSGITYMKRYGLTTVLGLKNVDADDDGDTASLPDNQVKTGNTNRAAAKLRGELENAAKLAGLTKAQLAKGYHERYGKDYKADDDEGNLAAAIVQITPKAE